MNLLTQSKNRVLIQVVLLAQSRVRYQVSRQVRIQLKNRVLIQVVLLAQEPSEVPSESPSVDPGDEPSFDPSGAPSSVPSLDPSSAPSSDPSLEPSSIPSSDPSDKPSVCPDTCECATDDTAIKTWKCGNDIYACPDLKRLLCENQVQSNNLVFYELTIDECEEMKGIEIGDKCIDLPRYC